jgi:ABC-type nitrate/sulfonate/bicarbonate transport system substrate-binding protein
LALLSYPASGVEKVKIGYPAFTGAYAPLWIALAEGLGRKHGLDLEAIFSGRTSPGLLLESGAVQCTVQTGFGTVQSYARGVKDHVIIASFANTTGFSIYSKTQITKPADLRGKVIGTAIPGDVTNSLVTYVLRNRLSLDPARDVKIVPLGVFFQRWRRVLSMPPCLELRQDCWQESWAFVNFWILMSLAC